MCGIAGWAGTGRPSRRSFVEETKVVNKILEFQHHRGPDARGVWKNDTKPIVLGHNRLSIIELSKSGAQPMLSLDGKWAISYNGELYNYKKLRKSLEDKFGTKFRGNSDTEVFLNGFINYGVDEFLRLADGMFSAAVYNLTEEELFLVRDRVGEKPLFYALNDNEIFFASELKGLACSIPLDRQVDIAGLQLYMLFRYVPAPHTILKNIFKLKPGHYLRYSRGNISKQISYFSWDPHASEVPPNQSNYQEVVKGTEALLVQSLQNRMMSDVPLGFFLSGGVDSTLCAALIRKHLGKDIHSYTIGFEGDSTSEHFVAEKTASIIGAKHLTKVFKQEELNEQSIEVLQKLDEPNGDRSCIPTYLLCKHAKSEITVALGGDGGDELFSGYSRYPGLNKKINSSNFYNPVEILKAYFSNRLPVFSFSSLSIFDKFELGAEQYIESLATHIYPPANLEQAIRFVDFKSYLPGAVLSKVDRMSMLVSLEVRTPFFSPQLMDLASRLPHEFLYRGSEMKPVLRDICRKIGLSHVADLPKKGFGMPAEFLNRSKQELVERAKKALVYMNSDSVTGFTDFGTKLSGFAGSNMNSLWATIVLGEWLQNLEAETSGVD